jgi:proteasome lid subunit RPN8/RPN11
MIVDAPIFAQLCAMASGTDIEICGALVGNHSTVEEVWPLANQSSNHRSSFLIPAEEVLRVEREAAVRGFDLIGFYHSHPDGTAVPSQIDLLQAVSGYLYLIVAGDREIRAWRLRADRSGFDEVLA